MEPTNFEIFCRLVLFLATTEMAWNFSKMSWAKIVQEAAIHSIGLSLGFTVLPAYRETRQPAETRTSIKIAEHCLHGKKLKFRARNW